MEDDILKMPGVPTFEEFCKSPDKYRTREDEKFGLADKGSSNLNRHVQRHRYEIEGYSCKNLEEVERVARAQGIPIEALDYQPEVIPQGGGKCDLLVKFVPKHVRQKRQTWG